MARTPNRTGMGDNYKKGGKRKKKMLKGGPLDWKSKKVGTTTSHIGKKSAEAVNVVNPRRASKYAQHPPFMDWMKEGSVSPRPFYEPTTKTWFPRLQHLGHEIGKTFRGEGDSMAIQYEDGGSMYEHGGERSTRNQGNQSLMGGNVEQHD